MLLPVAVAVVLMMGLRAGYPALFWPTITYDLFSGPSSESLSTLIAAVVLVMNCLTGASSSIGFFSCSGPPLLLPTAVAVVLMVSLLAGDPDFVRLTFEYDLFSWPSSELRPQHLLLWFL